MSLDLSSISELQSAEVELLHPVTKAPTGAFVTLAGPEHPARKKVQLATQRKLQARMWKSNFKQPPISDPDEVLEQQTELLAASVLGLRSVIVNGTELSFTPENVRLLLGAKWVREQLLAALDETERFFKDSAAG